MERGRCSSLADRYEIRYFSGILFGIRRHCVDFLGIFGFLRCRIADVSGEPDTPTTELSQAMIPMETGRRLNTHCRSFVMLRQA